MIQSKSIAQALSRIGHEAEFKKTGSNELMLYEEVKGAFTFSFGFVTVNNILRM
jgi:hypothetical protein